MSSAAREQAKRDYVAGMKYKDLAQKYGVSINTIKSWKQRYKWNRKGMHTKEKVCTQKKSKQGAPPGNKNAVGNQGGAPEGNNHAVKHGFFSRIFPDDEETLEIIGQIQVKSPLEILWEQIIIQYTAIARAQKLMFVKDQEDITSLLKRERYTEKSEEREYEIQFAWDKHATFLNAQSRAMRDLERLIARYEELLIKDLATEEQQLKINKLKAELEQMKDPEDTSALESFIGQVDRIAGDENA